MIAALSPSVSWVLFVACIAVGFVVYVVVAGRLERRFDARERFIGELVRSTQRDVSDIRVFGGVYDHEAHGDFE